MVIWMISCSMKIFVSRHLSEDSPLKRLLDREGIDYIDQSFTEIVPVSLSDEPKEDFLFFSSSNGVKNFFSQYVPSDKIYGAIGPATARTLTHLGYPPDFIGHGQSREVATQLLDHYPKGSIAFISGAPFSDIIEMEVEKYGLQTSRYFVYFQQPRENRLSSDYDVYIFTSPLQWDTFTIHNTIPVDSKIIAIGTTTADFIKEDLSEHQIFIPKSPSEEEICLVLEEWITA